MKWLFTMHLKLMIVQFAILGDEILRTISKEIADKVRANATIDWTIRESARAKLMVLVKRTLTKYGYPPDKQQKAIDISFEAGGVVGWGICT